MYEWQANAFLIRPGEVLNIKLKDMTVGHLFLLEAIDSPFPFGGRLELSDLLLAVKICSMDFEHARKFIFDPPETATKIFRDWGRTVARKKYDIEKEIENFEKYIKVYMQMPELWSEKEDGQASSRQSGFPLAMRLAWNLMSRMSEKEAYNFPMTRAVAYYGIESERNGQNYQSADEYKIIQQMIEDKKKGKANGAS